MEVELVCLKSGSYDYGTGDAEASITAGNEETQRQTSQGDWIST